MRIRTVKPEFFTHEALWELERETGLPVRVAYVGLWCCADREGRFKWEPRRLGVQILPYDEVDFSRVLHALTTRAFVVKYRVNDACFGCIPSFPKHQIINNRESESIFPSVESGEIEAVDNEQLARVPHASTTRQPRVPHASKAEGKGREGERNGKEGDCVEATREEVEVERPRNAVWDAVVEVANLIGPFTTNEAKRVGKVVKELKAVMAGFSDEEMVSQIKRRASNYALVFPGATLTDTALLNHWSKLDAVRTVQAAPGASQGATAVVSPNVQIIQWTEELKDCTAKMEAINNSYDSHQGMTQDDADKYNRLLARKKELKAKLDRKI
jgi:hypothetical protein